MVRCTIIAVLFLWIVNEKHVRVIKPILYIIALGVFFFLSTAYFAFFLGMVVAEVAERYSERLNCRRYMWLVICGICVFLFPFLFNENHLSSKNEAFLGMCFAVLLLSATELENMSKLIINRKAYRLITFLDKNSFAFYLLHVLVLKTFSNNAFSFMQRHVSLKEECIIMIVWIFTVIICWGVSDLFTKYVLIYIKNIWRKRNESIAL